jgi:hypothetical protein
MNAWPEIVLRMIAISFSLSPQTMGIERDVNRNTAEVMQSEEFSDAVSPVLHQIEDELTLSVLWKVMGWTDLRFKFVDSPGDPIKEAGLATQLAESDLIFINEAREKVGMNPLPPDDPRGKMMLTELRASIQASSQPQMPGMPGGDPIARLLEEAQQTGEQPPAAPKGKTAEEQAASLRLDSLDSRLVELADMLESAADSASDRPAVFAHRDEQVLAFLAEHLGTSNGKNHV